MRILHVTDRHIPPKPSDGGAPHSLDSLRLAQIRQGDDPLVASSVRNRLPGSVYLDRHEDMPRQLMDVVAKKSIDIVHFHAGAKGLQPMLEQEGVPSVAHIRSLRSPDAPRLANPIYVSRSHALYHGGAVYIHNGIDLDRYPYGESPKDALAFLGKVKRSKKGAAVAINVARASGKRLWLMGGKKLSLPSTWLPLFGHVKSLGIVAHDRKVSRLRRAKALLFPSQWDEPFGIVLIEAMACGTPVIAFNRGAASEVIEHGKTGFVVETTEEMCDMVSRIDDIDRAACRCHVQKNFTIERTATQVKACYERVLGGDHW